MNGALGVIGHWQSPVAVIIHSVASLQHPGNISADQSNRHVHANVDNNANLSAVLINLVRDVPNLGMAPLQYLFRIKNFQHIPYTLWLEFGVYEGKSISYIAKRTTSTVYGFDSFHGLPENWRPGFPRGEFDRQGAIPDVPENVVLIKGLFQDTLGSFLNEHRERISFLHIDSDLYSSAKFILEMVKDRLSPDCVVIFDELVNYIGFDGENGELKAWYEFITENEVDYKWIGMKGNISFKAEGFNRQAVGLVIHSLKARKSKLTPRQQRIDREAQRYTLRKIVENIPNVRMHPLLYLFQKLQVTHQPNTSWLSVGVYEGLFINTMAEFTSNPVYGIDHFYGLEEYWRPGYPAGLGSRGGQVPAIRENVVIVSGEYNQSLPYFLNEFPQPISLLYVNTMVYGLTKYVLDTVRDHLAPDCLVVFNDLVNYIGYDGRNGELRAWYEFLQKNEVDYEWIGMEGHLFNNIDSQSRAVALRIRSIKQWN
jgi:hypothetical protein